MGSSGARLRDQIFNRGSSGVVSLTSRWVAQHPGVRALRRARDWERFRQEPGDGSCWGVYEAFADAEAAVPLALSHVGATVAYGEQVNRLEPEDFAVLYWLERTLAPGQRVFEVGGKVGGRYYAYKAIGALPSPVQWTVYDASRVVDAGRQVAAQREADELSFTTEFSEAAGAEALLLFESLPYFEQPIWERLSRLEQLPHDVIISAAPVVDGPRFVTLQHLEASYRPYLIEDRRALVRGMAQLGYHERHHWPVPGKGCVILNRSERSVSASHSFHFALDEARRRES